MMAATENDSNKIIAINSRSVDSVRPSVAVSRHITAVTDADASSVADIDSKELAGRQREGGEDQSDEEETGHLDIWKKHPQLNHSHGGRLTNDSSVSSTVHRLSHWCSISLSALFMFAIYGSKRARQKQH